MSHSVYSLTKSGLRSTKSLSIENKQRGKIASCKHENFPMEFFKELDISLSRGVRENNSSFGLAL